MKRNTLEASQKFQLQKWLDTNWTGHVEKGRLSREQVAASATKTLGFPVTACNIKGACRAIQKDWPHYGGGLRVGTHAINIICQELLRTQGQLAIQTGGDFLKLAQELDQLVAPQVEEKA